MEDIADLLNKHFKALDEFMALPSSPKASDKNQGWEWYQSLRGIVKDAFLAGMRYGKHQKEEESGREIN